MTAPQPSFGSLNAGLSNQTARQIVHVTVGGARVRVRLSNLFGSKPLEIGAAHIARSAGAARIVANSDVALTFGGAAGATVPPGREILSDPATFAVPAFGNIAVSLYVPGLTGPATWHEIGLQDGYVSPPGDFTAKSAMPVRDTNASRLFLTSVEVTAAPAATIVALGDSITDGAQSTPNANRRWPDDLARRLGANYAVVNSGISGGRVLRDGYGQSALKRFDRDVLAVPGVTHVIVLLGTNDIVSLFTGEPPSPTGDAIVAGLAAVTRRAHARGIVAVGATLLPRDQSPEEDVKRQAVNARIRGGGVFDAVIDWDAVLRDPAHPDRIRPAFSSGDGTHPNDAGYQAMADAVPASVFGEHPN